MTNKIKLLRRLTWWQQHTELKMIQVNHLSNPAFDQMALKIKCTSIAQYSQWTEWIRGRHLNLMNILMGTKCFGTCTSSDQMYYTSIFLFFTIFKKNKSVYFLDSLRITVNRFHAKQTDSLQKYASFWWTLWYSLIVHWNMLCTNVLIYCYLL